MKIFGRNYPINKFPSKVFRLIETTIQIYKTCKNPSNVLSAYLKRKNPEYVETKEGLKVYLSTCRDDISTFIIVFCNKDYGDFSNITTMVDIGGNIGIVSMFAISRGVGKIYTFEPNKEAFATIQKSIKANHIEDRLIAFNLAVSSKTGDTLYIPKKSNPANVSCAHVSDSSMYDAIRTVSLEDFIKEKNIQKIDLLKLDCEGAEYELLPTLSKESIATISEIKMEYHDTEQPLFDWLELNNFKVFYYKKVEEKLGYIWAKNKYD